MGVQITREAGRVLLVDAADRVLLFCGADSQRPEDGRFWFTPGGGLDDGETHAQGAVRELAEETGLAGVTPAELGRPVWERDCTFEFEAMTFRQHELFFLLRVDAHVVDVSGFSELEQRTVHDYHWWPVAELLETTEVVFPTSLGTELERLLREGAPPTPRRVVSDDGV